MKKLNKTFSILGLSLLFLSGCGNHVQFKSDEDREDFTQSEIETVENKVNQEKGVADFEIKEEEGGYYAELHVKDKKNANDLAIKAFNLMWAETNKTVDLFVMKKGKKNDILIEGFKPAGTDEETEWDNLM